MRAVNRDRIEPFISYLLRESSDASNPTLPSELPLGKRKITGILRFAAPTGVGFSNLRLDS